MNLILFGEEFHCCGGWLSEVRGLVFAVEAEEGLSEYSDLQLSGNEILKNLYELLGISVYYSGI